MSNLNLNKVILVGHITADLELKQTTGRVAVASFGIAVNRRAAKDKEMQTDFINCVAWRQTAEFICRYFKKGSAICVVGSIQTRSWQDQQGNRRYATEIVADEAYFVDGRMDAQSANAAQNENAGFSAPSYSAPASAPKFEELKTDDDLPF